MSNDCQACGQKIDDVLIVLVLDESGSMLSQQQTTLDAVNEYVEGQKSQPGTAHLMVNTFDCRAGKPNVRTILEEVPIRDAPKLTSEHYSPYGSTPLYDAFGETMKQVNRIAKGRRVLFILSTDGLNNASEKWNMESVSKEMKKHKWQFVFLGANIDAWSVGHAIGGDILLSNSLRYANTQKGIQETWQRIGASSSTYRGSSHAQVMNFAGDQVAVDTVCTDDPNGTSVTTSDGTTSNS